MPEPRRSLSDAEVARELAAIQARLAALAGSKGRDVADELIAVRDTLHRLAADNEDIRKRLETGRELRDALEAETPPEA